MIVTSLILICKTKYYYDALAPSIPTAPLSPSVLTSPVWVLILIFCCDHMVRWAVT